MDKTDCIKIWSNICSFYDLNTKKHTVMTKTRTNDPIGQKSNASNSQVISLCGH